MSTLRINNIEAQSIPASPTLDEKVKITNSSGDILVNIDGKTSGITTIGINTTDGNIKFDENSNVVVTGVVTATKFSGDFEPVHVNASGIVTASSFVGTGVSVVGVVTATNVSVAQSVTATTYYGSGANLTGIDATSIKHTDGDVKAQASATGVNITGNLGIGNTTTTGRNAGVSTATGALIYNTTTNALEVYNGSSWLSVTSKVGTFNISYLVVGGGGAGGGNYRGGGGGAGALRTNWNNETQGGGTSSGSAKSINIGTSYAIGVGTAGVGRGGTYGLSGGQSTFDDIVSKGGGGGGRYNTTSGDEDGRPSADPGGGSGGGGGGGQASSSTGVGGASGTYGSVSYTHLRAHET